MFLEGETVILNDKVKNGLPNRIGDIVTILENICDGFSSYNYRIQFEDGTTTRAKESELNKLTKEQQEFVTYIKKNNTVLYTPTNEEVKIETVDYIHGQVVIRFNDNGVIITGFEKLRKLDKESVSVEQPQIEQLGKFTELAYGIGEFTDMKNKQYGSSVDATYDMIKVLMERYKNQDNTYTIPESLLQHILLQVRMMDKINRIFNNPSGEGDSESPYRDLCGYSLIGIDMVEG
jgi:hypothetical protein